MSIPVEGFGTTGILVFRYLIGMSVSLFIGLFLGFYLWSTCVSIYFYISGIFIGDLNFCRTS